jgi:hypothetical protein
MSKDKLSMIFIIILLINLDIYSNATTLTQEEITLDRIQLAETLIRTTVNELNKAELKNPDNQLISELNIAINLITLSKRKYNNMEFAESILKASESIEITNNIISNIVDHSKDKNILLNTYSPLFIYLILLMFVSLFSWIVIKKYYRNSIIKMKPEVNIHEP